MMFLCWFCRFASVLLIVSFCRTAYSVPIDSSRLAIVLAKSGTLIAKQSRRVRMFKGQSNTTMQIEALSVNASSHAADKIKGVRFFIYGSNGAGNEAYIDEADIKPLENALDSIIARPPAIKTDYYNDLTYLSHDVFRVGCGVYEQKPQAWAMITTAPQVTYLLNSVQDLKEIRDALDVAASLLAGM